MLEFRHHCGLRLWNQDENISLSDLQKKFRPISPIVEKNSTKVVGEEEFGIDLIEEELIRDALESNIKII